MNRGSKSKITLGWKYKMQTYGAKHVKESTKECETCGTDHDHTKKELFPASFKTCCKCRKLSHFWVKHHSNRKGGKDSTQANLSKLLTTLIVIHKCFMLILSLLLFLMTLSWKPSIQSLEIIHWSTHHVLLFPWNCTWKPQRTMILREGCLWTLISKPTEAFVNASHSTNLFTNSCDHIFTNGKAPLHSHINHNNPQFLYSLWRRANARNVSFLNLSRW